MEGFPINNYKRSNIKRIINIIADYYINFENEWSKLKPQLKYYQYYCQIFKNL